MDTSLDDHPLVPEVILKLIEEALSGCRESPSRLCGLVRGLEIGASTPRRTEPACDQIDGLRKRSLRLLKVNHDYELGVSLGIDLSRMIASKLLD